MFKLSRKTLAGSYRAATLIISRRVRCAYAVAV
jgi:hypothetical protein